MTHGMIVAPQPEAVEAGALVLKRGGNPVDAAIACALVQGVVDPCMTGIAGFRTLHLHTGSGDGPTLQRQQQCHRCLQPHTAFRQRRARAHGLCGRPQLSLLHLRRRARHQRRGRQMVRERRSGP